MKKAKLLTLTISRDTDSPKVFSQRNTNFLMSDDERRSVIGLMLNAVLATAEKIERHKKG